MVDADLPLEAVGFSAYPPRSAGPIPTNKGSMLWGHIRLECPFRTSYVAQKCSLTVARNARLGAVQEGLEPPRCQTMI